LPQEILRATTAGRGVVCGIDADVMQEGEEMSTPFSQAVAIFW